MYFENDPEAVQYREWFQSVSTKPGVMVLTYEPDNVVPVEYQFLDYAPEPNVEPSCGVRLFMRDYDGNICNVEYFTAYPKLVDPDTEQMVDGEIPDIMAEHVWATGWGSVLETLAYCIGTMQSNFMYQQAEQIGFDMDEFIEHAEQHMDPMVATHFAVVYLRFLLTKNKAAALQPESRQHAADFLLGVISAMLDGVRQIVEGKHEAD